MAAAKAKTGTAAKAKTEERLHNIISVRLAEWLREQLRGLHRDSNESRCYPL